MSLYLSEKSQRLQVPERIFFHLVESKEEETPFAFLATYATAAENGRVRHMPLQYALTEYKEERHKLLELLSCLNKASEVSPLIAGFVESGELFHPLRLTAGEAYHLLRDVPALEEAGILCRIPNWWKRRNCAVSVSVRIGDQAPSLLGLDSLLNMVPSLTVDGIPLTEADIRQLLSQTEGLSYIKGKWIEVDHARLRELLAQLERYDGSITLLDALRSDISTKQEPSEEEPVITNGKWLSGLLKSLRNPGKLKAVPLPDSFHGQLRPYQESGVGWLTQMDQLGFGACLADDMGLGKTLSDPGLSGSPAQPPSGGPGASGGPGLPSGQLAKGDGPVCSRYDSSGAPWQYPPGPGGPVRDIGGLPHHHQLPDGRFHRASARTGVGLRDPGRGSGHQEPHRKADPAA